MLIVHIDLHKVTFLLKVLILSVTSVCIMVFNSFNKKYL